LSLKLSTFASTFRLDNHVVSKDYPQNRLNEKQFNSLINNVLYVNLL